MESVHDYEIKNYFVDFEKQQLSIKISSETDVIKEILFKNMFSYKFFDEMPYSIILDLEQRTISDFFKENKELIEAGKKSFWPIMFDSNAELEKEIKENNQKYWVLSASYGLYGWILCEEVEILTKN